MFATLQHDIAQQIDSIKAQIEQLHHQQIALESHLQAIGTVEQACHSAIAQLQHALSGIRQVCPKQESEFWDTLDHPSPVMESALLIPIPHRCQLAPILCSVPDFLKQRGDRLLAINPAIAPPNKL